MEHEEGELVDSTRSRPKSPTRNKKVSHLSEDDIDESDYLIQPPVAGKKKKSSHKKRKHSREDKEKRKKTKRDRSRSPILPPYHRQEFKSTSRHDRDVDRKRKRDLPKTYGGNGSTRKYDNRNKDRSRDKNDRQLSKDYRKDIRSSYQNRYQKRNEETKNNTNRNREAGHDRKEKNQSPLIKRVLDDSLIKRDRQVDMRNSKHYSKSKATPVLSPGNNHSYISRSYHSSSSNKTKVKSRRVSSEDNKPPKAYRNSSDDEMSEGFRRQKYKRNKKSKRKSLSPEEDVTKGEESSLSEVSEEVSDARQSEDEHNNYEKQENNEHNDSYQHYKPVKSKFDSSSYSEDYDEDEAEQMSADDGSPPYVYNRSSEEEESPQEESSENEEELEIGDILPFFHPHWQGCRSVDEFKCLNKIEEGTYGVVYRAHDNLGRAVALKRLKMEKEKEGFPITSLREINTLGKAHHENIVKMKEVVVGSNIDKIYLVMEYVEHDLKSLIETMKEPFLIGEVKTLSFQLLDGLKHLHDNWIIHRDLKTSNLLLSHKGILKIADFGLAREFGSPLMPYTPIVVTLWYRAIELLLGQKIYSKAIDMWSVGCIVAELMQGKALFQERSEINMIKSIYKTLGTPNDEVWKGFSELPHLKTIKVDSLPRNQVNTLRKKFSVQMFDQYGMDLLNKKTKSQICKTFWGVFGWLVGVVQ